MTKKDIATEQRPTDIFAFIARKREELRQNRLAKAYQLDQERNEAGKQQARPDTL